MRAVDTNILIYAETDFSALHERAAAVLTELGEGGLPWAIPWPCIYEFLRVVTHSRTHHPPIPPAIALSGLRSILASPTLVLLSETPRHADVMEMVVRQSGAAGNLIHDAHIAALCLEHGISELITGDRDFHRFPGLRILNPFRDATT